MIDTHIHLSNSMFQCEFPYLSVENGEYIIERGTREQLIEKLKSAGIESCIEPAIDIESNFDILTLAEKYPSFFFFFFIVKTTQVSSDDVVYISVETGT